MAASGNSTRVIFIALFANLGIAIAKGVGSVFTGSSALLAEAVHSAADCMNQVFLLIGAKSALREPSESHPLGYGRESFFWSFLVAVLLFFMGGVYAVAEGSKKLSSPEAIQSPWIVLGILGFGIALEGYAFYAVYREVQRVNPYSGIWEWFRKTTRADLLVIFTEDFGALAGLVTAAICVSISWITGDPSWDAIGSIAIGILLLGLSLLIAIEVRSLIIGETPSRDYRAEIAGLLSEEIPGAKILRFIALQTSSEQVLVSYKISIGEITDAKELVSKINQLEKRVKSELPTVRWQFVEPDLQA
jgi:cation diffusion facilitator family transporter